MLKLTLLETLFLGKSEERGIGFWVAEIFIFDGNPISDKDNSEPEIFDHLSLVYHTFDRQLLGKRQGLHSSQVAHQADAYLRFL